MTTDSAASGPLEELRYALAEADADAPPNLLRARVLGAATSARHPGLSVLSGEPISALDAFRRTVAAMDTLLADLGPEEWHVIVLRGLDAQGLIGHLIGVERDFHVALGIAPGLSDSQDHVVSTQPSAEAQAGRDPLDTHLDWRAAVQQSIDHLAALDPAAVHATMTLHTVTATLDQVLVVRSFETWIHEEDIRRATGRPLATPEGSRLQLMTQVAVPSLRRGLALAGRLRPGRTARIVLTGPGGGTWQTALDQEEPGPADVRIVADAASFCRLIANRLDAAQLGAAITGDEALADDVLVGARALALD